MFWHDMLLSKQGKVITTLAESLLHYRPEDRIPSMQEYAQMLDVSVGTVQSAMNQLQAAGAVELEARGRLGAFVRAVDYGQLWLLAYNRSMLGILPLPFSRRLEGLATGLRFAFNEQPFSLELRFVRGASTRLQRLQSKQCDWTAVSRYVAETASVHGFDIHVVALLGPETYTVNQVLLMKSHQALTDGMRIGIDPNSTDHAYIVRFISRGKQVEFVEMDYSQGLELLNTGQIDATVWTQDDVPPTVGDIQVIALDTGNAHLLGEAAVVTQPENNAVIHVLETLLQLERIRQTQVDVINRVQLPSY